MVFEWRKQYNVGIQLMDDQHHKLVDILNRLERLIREGSPGRQSWVELVNELSAYTEYHFSAEEGLMRLRGYEHYPAHCAEHAFFIQKIELFRKGLEENDMNAVDDLLYFLMVWLQNHILVVDHQLAAFLTPDDPGSPKSPS